LGKLSQMDTRGSTGGAVAAALTCCWSNFFQVYAPKFVLIDNRRLGYFFRGMQLVAVIYVAWTLIVDKPWLEWFEVKPYGVRLWVAKGEDLHHNKTAGIHHCEEPRSYRVSWNEWSHHPTRCDQIHPGEMYGTIASNLNIPTFVSDTYTWTGGKPGPCPACPEGMTSTLSGATGCACKDEFFNRNAEDYQIVLVHGFEVTLRTHFSKSQHEKEHGLSAASDAASDSEGSILTIVEKQDGTPCAVGASSTQAAKARWRAQDASMGIHGTIREWLACAGARLDQEVTGFSEGRTGVLRMRLAGGMMKLELRYVGPGMHGVADHSGVVCYLRVSVISAWNAKSTYSYLPFSHAQEDATEHDRWSHRYRMTFGMKVHTDTSGSFGRFSPSKLLDLLVNIIVIVMFPANVIYWFTLYAAGLLSAIYYRAACEELVLSHYVSSVGVRMMASAMSFRCITRQEQVPSDTLRCMSAEEVFSCMAVAMKGLDEKAVATLVGCIMSTLDRDGSNDVALREWIETSCLHDKMDIHQLMAFFEPTRRRHCLERLFDDSWQLRSKMFKAQRKAILLHPPEVTGTFSESFHLVPESLKPLFSPVANQSAAVVEEQPIATAATQQGGTEAAQSSSSRCMDQSQLEDAVMDPFKKAVDGTEAEESKSKGVWPPAVTPIARTPRAEFMADADFLEQLAHRLQHVEQILNAAGEGSCSSFANANPTLPCNSEIHLERQRQALVKMDERLCSLRDEIATCMHELSRAATLQLDLWRQCSSEVIALINSALDQRLGSPGGLEDRLETLQKDNAYHRILLENLERLQANSRKVQTPPSKVPDSAKRVHSELSKHFVKASPMMSPPASVPPSSSARVALNAEHRVALPASKQESCSFAGKVTVARSTSPQSVAPDMMLAQARDTRASPPPFRGRSPCWLGSNVQKAVPLQPQPSLVSVAQCQLQQPADEQQQQQKQQQQWQIFGQRITI